MDNAINGHCSSVFSGIGIESLLRGLNIDQHTRRSNNGVFIKMIILDQQLHLEDQHDFCSYGFWVVWIKQICDNLVLLFTMKSFCGEHVAKSRSIHTWFIKSQAPTIFKFILTTSSTNIGFLSNNSSSSACELECKLDNGLYLFRLKIIFSEFSSQS